MRNEPRTDRFDEVRECTALVKGLAARDCESVQMFRTDLAQDQGREIIAVPVLTHTGIPGIDRGASRASKATPLDPKP